ncbi:MAG: TIM44-like domain-containing protein [Synergistaceae bacterium]|nr:TIM44-like domain-containing protein [Synergistaceae bacterium]
MRQKFLTGLLIIALILFAGSAWPDFGSFSGNSDYGGGGSSSSSESSGGGSYSSSSSGGGSDFNFSSFAGGVTTGALLDDDDNFSALVGVIVFIFIVYMIIKSMNAKKEARRIIPINVTPAMNLHPISEYLRLDPNFNESAIKSLISNLYVQMQDTWHAKDISPLRPYMTDEFFSQMDRQLNAFRLSNKTDYTENIAVLGVNLKGWRQYNGMDYIIIGLTSRIVSYVLDDRTGELLSGDKNREKFMEYEIELSRKSGVITSAQKDETHSERCPHCGAPLKLNASAQCEYCGSVVTRVNIDWAICSMKGISQRTA